ncbi:hypothetical protein HK100_009940 [Physocladia obscura]|uniref:Uncharacterized protein n=1 Tax=Physocladia obscura TaxID=109957 RepID=A0AAD5XMC1_9FUNG|nr:hypothetical protein HK100_009940 [Physocladia obscura]
MTPSPTALNFELLANEVDEIEPPSRQTANSQDSTHDDNERDLSEILQQLIRGIFSSSNNSTEGGGGDSDATTERQDDSENNPVNESNEDMMQAVSALSMLLPEELAKALTCSDAATENDLGQVAANIEAAAKAIVSTLNEISDTPSPPANKGKIPSSKLPKTATKKIKQKSTPTTSSSSAKTTLVNGATAATVLPIKKKSSKKLAKYPHMPPPPPPPPPSHHHHQLPSNHQYHPHTLFDHTLMTANMLSGATATDESDLSGLVVVGDFSLLGGDGRNSNIGTGGTDIEDDRHNHDAHAMLSLDDLDRMFDEGMFDCIA